MDSKNKLRKEILNIRNNLSKEQVLEKSNIIINKLIKLDEYKRSKSVFTYIDFKNEVRTFDLIKTMLKEGREVIIPYTDTINTKLIPVRLKNIDKDLKKSSFGYLEPKEEILVPSDINNIDLIIVPGVVFDKSLNRIGFGKGYYDRVLSQKRNNTKAIAIAYEFQVFDEIPSEEHDVKMDVIITEESVYNNKITIEQQ